MRTNTLVGALVAFCATLAPIQPLNAASCTVNTTASNTTLNTPFMGRTKMLVGFAGDDTSATSAPFDLRYRYINSSPFSTYNHASCMLNVGANCPWWGGWQEQGVPGGLYATRHVAASQAITWQSAPRPQIPAFTYYMILPASGLQEGTTEVAAINDPTFLTQYFDDWRFLLQKIGNNQALLHVEPDFWGFVRSLNSNPAAVPAKVAASNPTDCGNAAQFPDNAGGFSRCMISMVRTYAPNAAVGLHMSPWAGTSPSEAQAMATFFLALGADQGDFVVTDMADRDAGYYETVLNQNWHWWDSTRFASFLTWSKTVTDLIGKPMVLWQIPLGNSLQNNTPNHYKDNLVETLFSHMGELRDANVVAMMFGAGGSQQTSPETDDGLLYCSAEQSNLQASGATPSIHSTVSVNGDPTPSRVTVNVTANLAATGRWLLVPESAAAPTSAQVGAGVDYTGVTVVAAGTLPLSANVAESITINGLSAGTRYALYVASEDTSHNVEATPVKRVFTTSATSYTAAAPGGAGTVQTALSGGGASCGLQNVTYQSANSVGTPPTGVTFPYGVANFTASNCTANGTITVTLTYPNALPANVQVWKYGPATVGASPSWYRHPATVAGHTITYTVTDNGVGDSSNELGKIIDPVGVGMPSATEGVPALGPWALACLAALLAGWTTLRGPWRRIGHATRHPSGRKNHQN
ncbi:choice-of-anchor U domain-containing protein [Hydrogenophaga soli]